MFKIVQAGNALPISLPVDPNGQFEAGMFGQLIVTGNQIVCGVSDGTAPLGIIDDTKTKAFSAPSVDEVKIAQAQYVVQGGRRVSAYDVQIRLDNPNVVESSFITSPLPVELFNRNGVILIPAGTELNFDADNDGIPDSLRTVVSYTYQIPNIPGDDTTAASGKVTIWFHRMIFQTDMYETNRRYPVNANLFVSPRGLLTTEQASPDHPGIAVVTGPPSAMFGTLEAMLL